MIRYTGIYSKHRSDISLIFLDIICSKVERLFKRLEAFRLSDRTQHAILLPSPDQVARQVFQELLFVKDLE